MQPNLLYTKKGTKFNNSSTILNELQAKREKGLSPKSIKSKKSK